MHGVREWNQLQNNCCTSYAVQPACIYIWYTCLYVETACRTPEKYQAVWGKLRTRNKDCERIMLLVAIVCYWLEYLSFLCMKSKFLLLDCIYIYIYIWSALRRALTDVYENISAKIVKFMFYVYNHSVWDHCEVIPKLTKRVGFPNHWEPY